MNRARIGIPRALFYYYYFPLWQSFFQNLSLEVIPSPKTDKELVDLGVQKTVDEVCFPVKIFFGHTILLASKVDYLFVPRLISVNPKISAPSSWTARYDQKQPVPFAGNHRYHH